jgi:hypothetical protein
MDNSLAQLSYDAALRSLDKQEQLLSELRARTGILLAASSLAASFLGRPALDEAQPLLAAVALAAFAVSIGASVYVLIPKKHLIFALAGPAIFEGLFEFREEMAEVYRRLAYDLDRFWEENDAVMLKLFHAYRIAAGALAMEVLLLLASVSDTLF